MPTLVLIDGNSLLYRGFFAMRALTTSAGQPTNAVYAFTNMVLSLMEQHKPHLMFCAWDRPEPTFRHERFADYKGTRQETPSDLVAQGPLARELCQAFGIPALEAVGFEADDIIGTLAGQGKAAGYDVLIVTGDLDALQLVEPNVRVTTTVKGVTDTVIYDEAAVEARYGLKPNQLVDLRALRGDSSDNIPGVPGIGEKTAVKLLQTFGDVDTLLHKLDEVTPSKVQSALVGGTESMLMSQELARIDRNVPLPEVALPAADLATPYAFEPEKVRAFFEKLEFRTLLKRLNNISRPTGAVTSTTETVVPVEEAPKSTAIAQAVPLTILEALPEKIEDPVGVALHVGENDTLHGIALAFSEGTVYYSPITPFSPTEPAGDLGGLFDDAAPAASPSQPEGLDGNVKALLANPAIPKITHDARCVLTILGNKGVELEGIGFDTELSAYLLGAGRRGSFPIHEVAADYAGRAVDAPITLKKERAGFDDAAFFEREKERALRSAEATLAMRAVQEPRLAAESLTDVLQKIELPVAPIISAMEQAGVCVDVSIFEKMSASLGTQLIELEKQIHALAGEAFTINSPKQLSVVLFEKLKLPASKKTTTGYSTDAEVLEQLAPDHEIVSLVLQYREFAKLKGTYTDAMPALVQKDGRIHTTLNQTVAATGRLSSINPNLQNIPIRTPVGREIRRAFVAPPGWTLISADYSQIELRLFAHVSEDTELCAAFDSGEDIHVYTASRVYGIEPKDVTKDMRRAAKTVNYAVLYGISDFALARQLKIPQAEAKALKENYFARFPAVKEYLDDTIAFAREKGYVQTILGRKRWIPDIHARIFQFRQAAERAASNMPIQGSSADIMKLAMIDVWKFLQTEKPQTRLLLQVHDELLFEAPLDEVAQVGARVQELMEKTYPLRVTLDVEVKTGHTWADVTPVG
ncbi:MAG: DNA polymerase I [Armatimonas sp.]